MLWEELTVERHLETFGAVCGLQGDSLKDSINLFISNLALEEHRHKRPGELSGGARRKLSLAIALIGSPSLILLDEPFLGVDAQSKRWVWGYLQRVVQSSAVGVIFATKYLADAEYGGGRICIMVRRGCNIFWGGFSSILSNAHTFSRTIVIPRYPQTDNSILLKNKTQNAYQIGFDGYMQQLKNRFENDATVTLFGVKSETQAILRERLPNAEFVSAGLDHYEPTQTYRVRMGGNLSFSELFRVLNDLKDGRRVVRDYEVGQRSLEQLMPDFVIP